MELAIDIIKQQQLSREQYFEHLYGSAFPKVAAFVSKMNGSFDDAKDIFQDALVIFFEKIEEGKVVINTSEEAYVLGIAKHLWVRKYKQDQRLVSFDRVESGIEIPADEVPDVNTLRLLRVLETAGKKCMQLLRAVYYEKISIKNVTNRLRYRNEHTVSVQKYKCLEKVRDTVKSKSMTYEQFLN